MRIVRLSYSAMTVLCFLLLIASFANGQSDTKSSLTFVIDVTRSMESVKAQVEAHAHGIFDAVVCSNESDIENFVLVTFADPAALKTSVNNVTSTKDRDEFKDALSLTLVSGADCPEYSMSGIKTAIENSKPGSTIYVFTDASAKDYKTYDHVKDMALKKEIRIVFILTGSCSKSSKKGYDVYTLLATDTSGQVFNLHKHSVFNILNWIKYSVVSRRILLKAKSFSPGDVLFLNYTTDLSTRDTSISLSGCNKSLIVTGPDGKRLELEDLVHLKNILVVKVNETKPGTHSVAFDCKTKTRLVVTAKSDIQFLHGFSGFLPTNLNDTTAKPSPDGKTYLSIKISGNFRPKTVNFVDAYDVVIPGYSLPLKPLNETKELYATGPFDTPFSMFRIIVTGLDLDHNATISRIGYTFRRFGGEESLATHNKFRNNEQLSGEVKQKIIISLHLPNHKILNKKPTVVIEKSPKVLIDKGAFLQLKCTVSAFPKPNITWEKDGTIVETNVYDYDLPYAYVSVHKMVNVTENNTFMCKANNSEGEDKQTVLVEIKSKPVFEVVEKPEDVTIEYNDLVHLKCKVDAYPHANVTWYKNGVTLSKEDGVIDDGSELMIQHMKLINEGKYSCNVKNEVQERVIRFKIKISGVDTPKFLNSTSDSLNFKEGTVSTIPCRIEKGTPEPTIHWYFDNGLGKYDEIIEAKDDEHLIMSNVNRKQAGKYKCVAINELGTDMMVTNVIVEYPPTIDNNTKPVTANAGDEVVLTCSGDGVPEPNITWTRDDKPLAGSKFTSASDHRLIFEADTVNIGVYKCKASNKLGSSEKAVLVKVNKAPTSVILEGNSIDAEYDEPLTITCKILAFPKPDIYWVNKSGKADIKYVIEEKSLYHYVSYLDIDGVTTNATYQCKTNNTLGSDQAEITVTTAKPYFNVLEKPEDKDHNVKYNDTAIFFCKVVAYPPAEVNWFKNGRVLANDDLYVSSNGSALTITHMQRADQGMYKCEANNSITRFSFPFKITISGLVNPKINHAPTNLNVKEKTNTTISCRIDAGVPKPSIQWLYKETSSRYYVEIIDAKDLEYLPLTNIDRRSRGAYKCVANNSEGTDWMETNVIVEYMPTIDNDTEPIIAKAGEEVTLTCTADGVPKPIVQWTKDDMPLIGSKFTITDHKLTFDVGWNDAGVYKCNASNPHGSKSKTINLEVDIPPTVVIEGDSKQRVGYGGFLQLKCYVHAHPAPDIRWTDSTSLTALFAPTFAIKPPYGYVSILNITRAAKNTTYQCGAENIHGDHKSSVIVEVGTKTYFNVIDEPRDTIIPYHTQGHLYCNIDAYPPAKIIWYKDLKEIKSEHGLIVTDGTLTFENMEPFQRGRYTCVAKNSEITKTFVAKVVVSGLESPKISRNSSEKRNYIREVLVRDVNITLSCKIEKGIPKPSIKWMYKNKRTRKYVEIKDASDLETYSMTVSGDTLQYACEVSNVLGFDSLKINLKLPVNQVIKRKGKKRRTLVAGTPNALKLECRVEKIKNLPRPEIKWIYLGTKDNPKNELLISKDGDEPYYHTTTFKSYKVSYDQRGLYTCIATDCFGTQSSDTFSVDVHVHIPKVIKRKGKKRRTLVAGTPNALKLECTIEKTKNLPRPKLKWINSGTKDNPKNELLISEDGDKSKYYTTTFKSYNVTYDQRGLYTCIATDYFGIQSSDSFIVDVNTPPKILNRVKVIRAVVHDTALSIHCIATGHPNPEFRWTHGGITEEGGETFTLYNLTTRHADFYNRTASFGCEAYNSVEADYAKFEVIIDDYPSLDNPNSTLKLELGKDVPLVCPIPHGDGDFLRWYKVKVVLHCKSVNWLSGSDVSLSMVCGPITLNQCIHGWNNKKLMDGELKIYNAKMSDAGLYTCRVSGATDSRSANVDLKVGRMLVFTNTDVRTKNFLGLREVVALDCSAMGIPNPKISWFHNGKAISATALYYRFKINNAKCGIYKCEVTNDFDTISRTFDVILNECLLKIDPNDRRQPLILTQRFTSPTYKYEDGYLYMAQNLSIILTCGTNGSFNYFAYDYMNAFCNASAKLEIEGDYDFSDLKCNKEVTPYVKWTGKACQGEDSEMVEIGYEIRTKTLAVYESCMDIVNDVPFYTKQSMSLPLAEVIPKVTWFEDRLKNNFEAMYDVDVQIEGMTSALGFWFHKVDRCVYTQRQLVDPQGVFPGVPQGATFTHLNVVPQWSSCSTKNWDDVESRVRNLLISTDELTVWTGTAEKLSLKDSYLNDQKIYLSDPKSRASPSPVSTYLWKVVQNRAKNASLAIIQINVPDLELSDVYSYIKCRDVCSRTNWMNSPEWSKTDRGYVFCCTLDQFEYTFEYRGRGIFGRDMDNPLFHV